MGLLFFLILLASHDIARAWEVRQQGGSLIPAVARRAAWSLLIVVLPAVLYAVSAFSDNAPDVSWESWRDKLTRASMSLVNYNLPLDIVSAGLLAAFLLTCARLRLIVIPLGSAVALGAVALLFAVSPFGFKGGGYLDARFAVMFGFLLFATILPMRLPRRPALLAAIAIVALFSLRTAHVAAVWYAHNRDLAQLRDAISAVEPGSRVLLAMVGIDEAVPAQREFMRRQYLSDGSRLDAHTAALLLIERHAFWAVLFANSEQQPIELHSPYREIANRTAGILDIRLLSASSPDPRDLATFPLEGQWSRCYDYVLLLEAAARPDFSHDNLELRRKSDYASLFRIRQHAPWVELLSRRQQA